jgi:glyoxylase-like metal-dependent hydrolase (beta-lactamase superfamily II)
MSPVDPLGLESPLPGLIATPPAPLPFAPELSVRSFVLRRDAGDVVVYNSPGLHTIADRVRVPWGPAMWVVGHEHEAVFGQPQIDIGAHIHERDREAASTLRIAGTFSRRTMLGRDFEVIPTPGHTPGTTMFLWDSGKLRVLFSGDALWFERGRWQAAVLGSSDRGAYLESLALLRDLEFDVLVPWAAPAGGPAVSIVTRATAVREIDAVISRVARGEAR